MALAAFFDSRTAAARAVSSALLAASMFGVGGAVAVTVAVEAAFEVRDDRTRRDTGLAFFALGVAAAAGVGAMSSVPWAEIGVGAACCEVPLVVPAAVLVAPAS